MSARVCDACSQAALVSVQCLFVCLSAPVCTCVSSGKMLAKASVHERQVFIFSRQQEWEKEGPNSKAAKQMGGVPPPHQADAGVKLQHWGCGVSSQQNVK